MPPPPEIIDSLESIIDIFLSGVRHRERAAFILCDNLVELACKTKAKQFDHNFNTRCGFYDAWNAPGVGLPPRTLGGMVHGYRDVRNNMQHGTAAATVDIRYCATAIITASQVIDRLWSNTLVQHIPYWIQVALRTIRLYSNSGDANLHTQFEDRMRGLGWRGPRRESVRANSVQVELGRRDNWRSALRAQPQMVEECLNELGIP